MWLRVGLQTLLASWAGAVFTLSLLSIRGDPAALHLAPYLMAMTAMAAVPFVAYLVWPKACKKAWRNVMKRLRSLRKFCKSVAQGLAHGLRGRRNPPLALAGDDGNQQQPRVVDQGAGPAVGAGEGVVQAALGQAVPAVAGGVGPGAGEGIPGGAGAGAGAGVGAQAAPVQVVAAGAVGAPVGAGAQAGPAGQAAAQVQGPAAAPAAAGPVAALVRRAFHPWLHPTAAATESSHAVNGALVTATYSAAVALANLVQGRQAVGGLYTTAEAAQGPGDVVPQLNAVALEVALCKIRTLAAKAAAVTAAATAARQNSIVQLLSQHADSTPRQQQWLAALARQSNKRALWAQQQAQLTGSFANGVEGMDGALQSGLFKLLQPAVHPARRSKVNPVRVTIKAALDAKDAMLAMVEDRLRPSPPGLGQRVKSDVMGLDSLDEVAAVDLAVLAHTDEENPFRSLRPAIPLAWAQQQQQGAGGQQQQPPAAGAAGVAALLMQPDVVDMAVWLRNMLGPGAAGQPVVGPQLAAAPGVWEAPLLYVKGHTQGVLAWAAAAEKAGRVLPERGTAVESEGATAGATAGSAAEKRGAMLVQESSATAGGLTDDGLALVERLVITLLRKADADLRSGPALVWQEIRTPAQLYGMRASRAVAYTELQVIKRIMRARQQARQQALAGH